VAAIDRATAPLLQRRELEAARGREQASLQLMLGESPAMRQTVQQAQRIAGTSFSLIIQGETGAGKSNLAFLIHNLSPRRERPFVTVTLGSLAETLVESQLFGHVKGAFTGAQSARRRALRGGRRRHPLPGRRGLRLPRDPARFKRLLERYQL